MLLHPLGQPVRHHPHALVNVHLKGVFFLIQRLLPQMNDGGRILNLSSGLARFALRGYAACAAMKGAVEVLSRYLAQELGPRGIAVNVVASGAIETDFGGGPLVAVLLSLLGKRVHKAPLPQNVDWERDEPMSGLS